MADWPLSSATRNIARRKRSSLRKSAPVPAPSEGDLVEAERRQVSVLFVDVVGFTAFSERSGDEAAYDLIQVLSKLMEASVREHGGVVESHTGDGVMAVFNSSTAFEDAPLRACRTALAIFDRLKAVVGEIESKHRTRPRLRIGINTGPAVVGQMESGSDGRTTVLGDTVNVAQRLQSLAEPDSVFISEATQSLVEGQVKSVFVGDRLIKGKADAHKVYRLESIYQGATRFEGAVRRGLSAFIGRERELDELERSFAATRDKVRVIDIVAEAGMGKSRLLHEFRLRIDPDLQFVLSGACSPDGQDTPFLPFIEVVRNSFQVRSGEAETEVLRKLETGLAALGLQTNQNLSLLLNLLGLKAPQAALAGLDTMLVGLRTRELLSNLLEARCRLSPVAMLIEDLHWIDRGSEELLGSIVSNVTNVPLLILHTRRPEYEPPWLDGSRVAKLQLEPLPAGNIRRLASARLGVDALSDPLARLVTEKAEGNAFFAEEIVAFLLERGALRSAGREMEIDPQAVTHALPARVQDLLTARINRLRPQDRSLLQAASAIGRRFNIELLAAASDDEVDLNDRLAATHAADLTYPEPSPGEHAFRHALLRDALYHGLLTDGRTRLHLKIAQAIERRAGDRVTEVVELLAHHYSLTDQDDKAFLYLTKAAAKSLGIYSIDEAGNYFAKALALLDASPDCADDEMIRDMLTDYTLYLNLTLQTKKLTSVVERFDPILTRIKDSYKNALIRHHYVLALTWSSRFKEAQTAQKTSFAMADRLGDLHSRAYTLASAIHLSSFIDPYPVEEYDALGQEATAAALKLDDAYLIHNVLASIGWDDLTRGRIAKAHESAQRFMATGRQMNDPRSMGYALALEAWVALTSDDYAAALDSAESSIKIARAPFELVTAKTAKYIALVLLRRPGSMASLREFMDECSANGWLAHHAGCEGFLGVALVRNGEIGRGIDWIKEATLRRERDGMRASADWYRMFLCEIYLQIILGKATLPAKTIAKNIAALAKIKLIGRRFIVSTVANIRKNPHFEAEGYHIGRCEMILGELLKFDRKREGAISHLTEARRIMSQYSRTSMLSRVEADMAEIQS
jgi:class 3 adenylate cyclase